MMKIFPYSTIVVTTTLLLLSTIGQALGFLDPDVISESSMAVSERFYQPIMPIMNDPFILMRFAFNNGRAANATSYCTDEDYIKIIEVFPLNMQARRYVRTIDAVPTKNTRQLDYPPFCATACAGFAPGTCRATRCVGYRRRSLMTTAPPMTDEGVSAVCDSTMSHLHTSIDNLIVTNEVTNTCKVFLARQARETYCALCNPGSS